MFCYNEKGCDERESSYGVVDIGILMMEIWLSRLVSFKPVPNQPLSVVVPPYIFSNFTFPVVAP